MKISQNFQKRLQIVGKGARGFQQIFLVFSLVIYLTFLVWDSAFNTQNFPLISQTASFSKRKVHSIKKLKIQWKTPKPATIEPLAPTRFTYKQKFLQEAPPKTGLIFVITKHRIFAIPEFLRISLIHLLVLILPVSNLFCFMFSCSPGLPPPDCAATTGHKRTPSTKSTCYSCPVAFL